MTPRYCQDRDLPGHAYLPGQGARPTEDGHPWKTQAWNGSEESLLANTEFLWGIDLYNHGYYWEAHEVWEGLWMHSAKDSRTRPLLQGLIQCTGAALKAKVGQAEGCTRLSLKGLAKIESIADASSFVKLDLPQFAIDFREFSSSKSSAVEPPKITLT